MTEKEQEHWFQVGKFTGLKEASDRLMKDALDNYKCHKDSYAKLLRDHAVQLEAQANEAHPGSPNGN